jgi:hypothetical protein
MRGPYVLAGAVLAIALAVHAVLVVSKHSSRGLARACVSSCACPMPSAAAMRCFGPVRLVVSPLTPARSRAGS